MQFARDFNNISISKNTDLPIIELWLQPIAVGEQRCMGQHGQCKAPACFALVSYLAISHIVRHGTLYFCREHMQKVLAAKLSGDILAEVMVAQSSFLLYKRRGVSCFAFFESRLTIADIKQRLCTPGYVDRVYTPPLSR